MQVATAVAEAPRDSIRTDVIRDAPALEALADEWNDAVERARIPHPFLTHEWIRSWWECFGAGRTLNIVVARRDGRIIGIAPLMREDTRMYGVPVRRLSLMRNDHAPRADFILAEPTDEACQAIWDVLAEDRDGWDVLLLDQLPEGSGTMDTMTRLAQEDGCPSGVWASGDSPYLEISQTWDEYLAGLTPKFRQNLRNRVSRLKREGDPQLEIVAGDHDLPSALDDVIRLEESGWKADAGTAISSDGARTSFYARFAERAAARGWLRLMFLTIGGRRIATSYALEYDRRLFLCKTGYDPGFETASPFKVLTSFIVRDAMEKRLCEVDFLGDPEAWKRDWTTRTRAHNWLFVFSNRGRGRWLHPLKFQLLPALKRSRARASVLIG